MSDAVSVPISLVQHTWKSYNKHSPKHRWLGLAEADLKEVWVRQGLTAIPIVGVRIVAHEIEHLTKWEFKRNEDHHDHVHWAQRTGMKNHYCGRSFSWRGFFTTKCLSKESVAAAKRLISKGVVTVNAEPGSLLNPPM